MGNIDENERGEEGLNVYTSFYQDDGKQYYMSPALNGSTIKDMVISLDLNLSSPFIKILEWDKIYIGNHAYIIFKIISGQYYYCHITGIPGSLRIEIRRTDNKYNCRNISSRTIHDLRHFMDCQRNSFIYDIQYNNCDHFASFIAKFLKYDETPILK